MQTSQGYSIDSLRRIQAFLDAHADVLGGVVTSGARKQLDASVAALTSHVTTQSGSHLQAKGATQTQYTLRQLVWRQHMQPIAHIAAARLPMTPELKPLMMPAKRPNTSPRARTRGSSTHSFATRSPTTPRSSQAGNW